VLVAIGVAGGGGRSHQRSTTTTARAPVEPATPVAVVARRVERIRDLHFRRLPPARRVSPAQAERAGLADFDRSYPAARRRADEALLERLGALPPGADLRREIGSAFREQVGGYYDPRTKRLAVVSGPASQGAVGDIVLAHELTHALEDQRYGLDEPGSQAAIDDRSLANSALVEGTATSVMLDYARRFLDPGQALSDLLPAALQSSRSAKLPRYLQDSLMFPYDGGLAFVNALNARLRGWALVDYALRRRRPASTEQMLHPEKYLADERPLPVPAAPAPGRGWQPVRDGTFGEFDTAELLRIAGARHAADAAAGWGGGRYTLWRRGRSVALALTWRWDTRRDARQAAAALATYRRFAARRGPVALASHGDVTALGFAPTPALARRLAAA
jgi:hypothetical protein